MPNPPKLALSVLTRRKYLINNFIFEGFIEIVKNFHVGMKVWMKFCIDKEIFTAFYHTFIDKLQHLA
jgi:hypothetical protein